MGATGAQGLKGDTGAQGAKGDAGVAGADGRSVLSGTAAPTAAVGAVGDFYLNTATHTMHGPKAAGGWPTGVALIGPQGLTGATGPQGLTGATGPQGAKGDTGATGATGPQGVKGDTGATGPAGATGAAGPAGRSVLNGTTDPTAGIGVAGDFYLNTSTKVLWGPKGASSWPGSGVSLVGPQGLQGIQGLQGVQGIQGLQGTQGVQGLKGDPGDKGPQGDPGARGDDGLSVVAMSVDAGGDCPYGGSAFLLGADYSFACHGAPGVQGLPGADGAPGAKGDKGDTGATGATGPKGDTGATGAIGPMGPQGPQGPSGVADRFSLAFFDPEATSTKSIGAWRLFEPMKQVYLKPSGAMITVTVSARTTQYGSAPVEFNLCYGHSPIEGPWYGIKTTTGGDMATIAGLTNTELRTVQLSGLVAPSVDDMYWVGPCHRSPDNLMVPSGMGFGLVLP